MEKIKIHGFNLGDPVCMYLYNYLIVYVIHKPLQIRHFNAAIPISIFKAAPIFNFLVLPFSVFGQPFRHKVHQIEGWLFQAIIVKYINHNNCIIKLSSPTRIKS